MKYINCVVYLFTDQWVVNGATNFDTGANPSAEEGGEDEGVDDQAVKVVDIIDTFRLQVKFDDLFSFSVFRARNKTI